MTIWFTPWLARITTFASLTLLLIGIIQSSPDTIEIAGGLFCLIGLIYALRNFARRRQIPAAQGTLDSLKPFIDKNAAVPNQTALKDRLEDGILEALIYSALGGAMGSFSSILAALPSALRILPF